MPRCPGNKEAIKNKEFCLNKVSDIAGRSQLRSASEGQLVVPYSKTKTIGAIGFYISGPTFWYFLPCHLRDTESSLKTFKEHLKTVLFSDVVGSNTLHALL